MSKWISRVNISIASIASYLPSSTENNDAAFAGTTTQGSRFVPPNLTPIQEAAHRAKEVDIQIKDAEQRDMVWAVVGDEYSDADAEGDDDDEYFKCADGTYMKKVDFHDPGVNTCAPIGKRNEHGDIEPLPKAEGAKKPATANREHEGVITTTATSDEAYFSGVSEKVPSHVGELVGLHIFPC